MSENHGAKSSSHKDELTRINEQQAAFEDKVLPTMTAPGLMDEYEHYVTMDPDTIKGLSIEQCATISLRLVQYAFYLQRCINRDKARIKGLRHSITKSIAASVQNYGGRWEFQEQQAIADNDFARKNHEILSQLEQRTERIIETQNSMKSLADKFKDLQFAKRSQMAN